MATCTITGGGFNDVDNSVTKNGEYYDFISGAAVRAGPEAVRRANGIIVRRRK